MDTEELIEKLGCVKYSRDKGFTDSTIDEVVEMLSAGVEVTANHSKNSKYFNWTVGKLHYDTHTAFLINIQPIKKETREERLKQFVSDIFNSIEEGCINIGMSGDGFYSRAKALLEEK